VSCELTATSPSAQARISGFTVTGLLDPTHAATVVVTVSGLAHESLDYLYTLNAAHTATELQINFPVPLPSTVGGSVTVTVPATGGTNRIVLSVHGMSF
jgi:hypothetical protein